MHERFPSGLTGRLFQDGGAAALGLAFLTVALLGAACAAHQARADRAPAAEPSPAFLPRQARVLRIVPPASVALDARGDAYVTGLLTPGEKVDFQTRAGAPAIDLRSPDGADAVVARYDRAGQVVWARAIVDDDPTPAVGREHLATGSAVTADDTLAVVGRFTGAITVGADRLASPTSVAYLAAFSAEDGAGRWAIPADLGPLGGFRSIASNPRSPLNRIAVCGQASIAARDLVDGAELGGQTDLVIAVLDSKGRRIWSAQLGGRGMENCSAVAVDDAGDLFAAGWFDGGSLTFPGRTPVTVNGPGTAVRKFFWVARFAGGGDGTGGARVLAAAAYGGSFGAVLPNAVAVAPGGGLLVAGQYTGDLTIGTTMPSAGQDDGFVARLDAATLAPTWAVRIGGGGLDQVKGVGASSSGDAVAVGVFGRSGPAIRAANGGADTSGAAGLSSAGPASVFVAILDGATGAARQASAYGGAQMQSGEAVAVNRFGGDQIALLGTLCGSGTYGPAGRVEAPDFQDTVLVLSSGGAGGPGRTAQRAP